MAVPKKKTSKSKTKIRRNAWKNKITKRINSALSLAKSLSNSEDKSIS